jgi:hypothetical protein
MDDPIDKVLILHIESFKTAAQLCTEPRGGVTG